jgi:MFS family permease
VIAIFMSATMMGSLIAGPLCGFILKYFDGFAGLHGWQWLFLVQGLPAIFIGALIYLLLKDKPDQAPWLSTEEKALVETAFQHDMKDVAGEAEGTFLQMLQDPKAYMLALVYFFLLGATYTMVFWVPTLIQSWGVKDLFLVGIYASIPNAAGIVGMILIGRHSDTWHERRWHFAVCVVIAAVGLFTTTLLQGNLIGSILALAVAVIGIASATPLFFALTSEYLSAGAAAGGLALISSLGNLGPAVSPSINGLILRSTGDNVYSIYFVMALYLLSGTLLLLAIRPAAAKDLPAVAPAH